MNKHLHEAIFGMKKVDALMKAFELHHLDYDVPVDEKERLGDGAYMFYAMLDEIKTVEAELEQISDDSQSINAT